MVQVDVFWSYGLGAGFAVAAARQLRVRNDLRNGAARTADLEAAAGDARPDNGGVAELRDQLAGATRPPVSEPGRSARLMDLLQNRYMMVNILYVALLFAPSGLYLVWDFPEWETMQAGTRAMPAWLIVLFAITNVTQAVLAFWVVERLVVHGRQYLGFVQAWFGYFGMFFILVNGWDRTGWHRFFSEDRADFLNWGNASALDNVTGWLTSSVALTLYGMGVILIPAMAVIMLRSIVSGYRIGGEYAPDRATRGWPVLVAATVVALLSGVPVAVVFHLLINELGWILGAAAGAVFTYVAMLRPGTGLLYLLYRQLGLEDCAYQRLVSARESANVKPRTETDAAPAAR